MSRLAERGLDYTYLDVNIITDRKIRRLRRLVDKHAPHIYIDLLCVIFKEGYYIQWNEDAILDIADLTGYEEDYITKVVDACFEAGLLSKEMYEEHHILTSSGIQKQYNFVCQKLKRKSKVEEFSLLIPSEEKGIHSEDKPIDSEDMPHNIGIGKGDNTIEESNREDSSCSSSSSPSPSVEVAPSEEEKQQEKFLSYMFFQNWAAPNKELERFIAFNNTENRCWAKMDKTQRESALILWKQKPEQPKRFGQSFLTLWGRIFDKMIEAGAPHEVLMHALSDNIAYKEPSTLQSEIHLPQDVRDFIEAHLDSHGFRQIFQKYLFAVRHTNKLMYHLCPP